MVTDMCPSLLAYAKRLSNVNVYPFFWQLFAVFFLHTQDAPFTIPTTIQSARAANCIYALLKFRETLEKQEVEPLQVQDLIPLCSAQYERIFNTTRIPGLETGVWHRSCYCSLMVMMTNTSCFGFHILLCKCVLQIRLVFPKFSCIIAK